MMNFPGNPWELKTSEPSCKTERKGFPSLSQDFVGLGSVQRVFTLTPLILDRIYLIRVTLAIIRVGKIEPAAGVPFRTLVAVRRQTARVLKHLAHVQQVPGHKGGIAVGEIVFRAT